MYDICVVSWKINSAARFVVMSKTRCTDDATKATINHHCNRLEATANYNPSTECEIVTTARPSWNVQPNSQLFHYITGSTVSHDATSV